jgi:hypothetical protein
MSQADISFGPFQESSYEEMGGASPRAINVVIDPKGVVSKRPGIAAYDVAPSGIVDADGITGLYADNTSQLFAIGGTPGARHIYKLLNGAALDLSTGPNATLRGTRRPTFAETEVYLVMAGGADMQKLHLQTLVSSQLGGDPPIASHVVANSSRLAANDLVVDKTKVRFSGISQGTVDTSGLEMWDNTGLEADGGFFTAEARPDPVMAVYENTNEIFVWGKDNVQIFSPAGPPDIWSPSATRESGTLAPYSIIKQGQDFFWLDQHRRIVFSDGRSFQNLEGPIKRQLDELTDPTDCFGYRVFVGHIDCLVWTFPTDGRTFVYQVGGGWSEWFGWAEESAQFKRFIVNAHHLRRDGGHNVVGTTDGRIGKLALDAYDDRGERIVSYVESGFSNRETDNLKRCRSINIAIRRGSNAAASLGKVEWRDDTGPWNEPVFIDTGVTGDNNCVRRIHSLGTYRRRQFRWTFSDAVNLSLLKVTEHFDILGS